jgi:hypothetical protein
MYFNWKSVQSQYSLKSLLQIGAATRAQDMTLGHIFEQCSRSNPQLAQNPKTVAYDMYINIHMQAGS